MVSLFATYSPDGFLPRYAPDIEGTSIYQMRVVSWLGYVIGSSKTSARRDVKGALRLTAVDVDDWLYARLVGECIDLVAHRLTLAFGDFISMFRASAATFVSAITLLKRSPSSG